LDRIVDRGLPRERQMRAILADRSKTDLSRACLFATLSEHKDVIKILPQWAEVDSRFPDGSIRLISSQQGRQKRCEYCYCRPD